MLKRNPASANCLTHKTSLIRWFCSSDGTIRFSTGALPAFPNVIIRPPPKLYVGAASVSPEKALGLLRTVPPCCRIASISSCFFGGPMVTSPVPIANSCRLFLELRKLASA